MTTILLSDERLVTLQQIRANAAWGVENFGKPSGIEPFAYTAESVEYLEQCLVRQEAVFKASELSINKYVHLLGAYLGECILANYGGEWQESPQGLAIFIQTKTQAHWLHPFHKVYNRITSGSEDNLGFYFSKLIPKLLASE
jgi:hypothetical protein